MMQTRQSSHKGGENAKKESTVMKEFLNENEKLVSENEDLVKKNENLAEAVKKLKMFINSEDLEKREEEMERLKMENEKLKEKLWTSKLKVKDFIQKLYEKDSQLQEKDDRIEDLENKIKELFGKESSEASVHQDKDFDEQMDTDEEVVEGKDDDDELEILEPPPKVFEEVTLDEDADDIAPPSESVNQTKSLEEKNPTSKDSDLSTAPTAPHSKLAEKGDCFDSEANIAQVKSGNPKSVSENILKREKVVKGIQESLALRQTADHDDKVARKSTKDLLNIGKKIERSLFRQFDGVSKKYQMKYRSIVQNIRNPQNEVLFRQILLSKISPRELVMMNTSDYAQVT